MSISVTDLEILGQTALQEFSDRIARGERIEDRDVERPAQRLEAKLEQLYAVAATMAQREPTLEGVTAIWARMVSICDSMSKALSDLHPGKTPHSDSYDRILDIRNACEENRLLHA
ncbi:MAG: hypothetical protein HY735_38055 [Verrucomicrobia bacterium]|nr:hypothetical protein [Verrucomicrobiota bacterium]